MNLHALAIARAESTGPIGVGLIGAGKFASMFLAQVPTMSGLEIVAIADLKPDAVRARLGQIGWSEERIAAVAIGEDAADVASGEMLTSLSRPPAIRWPAFTTARLRSRPASIW